MKTAILLLPALVLSLAPACKSPEARVEDLQRELREERENAPPPDVGGGGMALRTTAAPGRVGAARSDLETRLATTLAGWVVEDEESLSRVVDTLRVQTGLPLVVAPAAEEAALDEGVVFDLRLEHPIAVRDALNLVAEMAGPDVAWTVRHDAVLFTTTDRARGAPVLAVYDVRTMTFAMTDFRAPRIDRLLLLDEIDEETNPFGSPGESRQLMTEDDLLQLVTENVAPESWDESGASIDTGEGVLIVRNTPAVQHQVARLLARLSGF